MAIHLSGALGWLTLISVLVVPGLIVGYVFHSPIWIAIVPCGLILLMIVVAALPIRRKITPQQFADQLESHLLGTDGDWGWDDATSVRLADERLEQLRVRLAQFYRLTSEEHRQRSRQILR